MKKLLLLAFATFMVASCSKDDEVFLYSQDFTVRSEHWKAFSTDDEEYFYYTFQVSQINRTVLNNGQISVTRHTDQGQSQLPEVRHFVRDNADWTETIRFDYTLGEITFIVAYSIFDDQNPPQTMDFRMVITSAD